MLRLKNRQLQVPGGMKFRLPALNWQSDPYSSFTTIVNAVSGLAASNPGVFAAQKWPTSRQAIETWVDFNIATVCANNGWKEYIQTEGDPGPPKSPPPDANLASVAGAFRKAASGAAVILEWEKSGLPPVSADISAARAATCANCSQNGSAAFTDWFTAPLSALLQKQIGRLHEMKLSTPHDQAIGTCKVCLCPLKLKVHAPLELVLGHLHDSVKKSLPDHCWILNESQP